MSPLLAGAEPAFLAFNIMYTTRWKNYYNSSMTIPLLKIWVMSIVLNIEKYG